MTMKGTQNTIFTLQQQIADGAAEVDCDCHVKVASPNASSDDMRTVQDQTPEGVLRAERQHFGSDTMNDAEGQPNPYIVCGERRYPDCRSAQYRQHWLLSGVALLTMGLFVGWLHMLAGLMVASIFSRFALVVLVGRQRRIARLNSRYHADVHVADAHAAFPNAVTSCMCHGSHA